jgi:radical SAM-linked protein
MGVFARAFKRADVPVRMSQGFNPRPRFSLPAPLPLGIEGLDEVLELDLIDAPSAEQLAQTLRCQLPPDIRVSTAEQLEPGEKARVDTVRYRATGDIPPAAIERCAASKELRASRRNGKEIDIRPYIRSIDRCDGGCEFEIRVTNEGSARPAEVIAALCGDSPDLAAHMSLVRTHVNLVPPQDQDASD